MPQDTLTEYFKKETEKACTHYESTFASVLKINKLFLNIPTEYSKVKKFFEKYASSKYDYQEFKFVVKALMNKDFTNLSSDEFRLVRDILSYLDYDVATQIDKDMLDEIRESFSLYSNITLVGTGKIPNLAERIRQEQKKNGGGTISAFDPEILHSDSIYPELKKIKKYLWEIPEETDLLIADYIWPNEQLFIEKAMERPELGAIIRTDDTKPHILYGYGEVTGDFFRDYMIDKYQGKGLEYHNKKGYGKCLIKNKTR